jgi:hypothetical protein
MEEQLESEASAQCPYCGEWVALELDPLGPSEEQYVEDCPVCCRPWVVHVQRSESGVESWLTREDD